MEQNPKKSKNLQNNVCELCGSEFYCGISAGEESCWCFDYPKVFRVIEVKNDKCICKKCLK